MKTLPYESATSAERGAESDVLRHVETWAASTSVEKLNTHLYACAVTNGAGVRVAWAYGVNPEQALANARLMAAAKDTAALLLRARKQIQAWHHKYEEFQPQWLPPSGGPHLLEDCDAALKKAGIE